MADECRDTSGTQQLSIVIRFVSSPNNCTADKNYVVKEYFLGFISLEKFDAITLANKIVEFLSYWKISLESCICLCFDGCINFFQLNLKISKICFFYIYRASVMSGCAAGVHVLLKKYMPQAVYIHCAAHRLNLVINDTCKVVCYVLDYFSIVTQIYSFFTASGVTNTYFKQAQIDLGLGEYSFNILSKCLRVFLYFIVQSSTLKLWADTRWDSRWTSINAVVNNFPAILKALHDLSEQGSGTRSTNASRLLMHVKKSIFIVTSLILHKLFGIIKVLSDHLKSRIVVFLLKLQSVLYLFF